MHGKQVSWLLVQAIRRHVVGVYTCAGDAHIQLRSRAGQDAVLGHIIPGVAIELHLKISPKASTRSSLQDQDTPLTCAGSGYAAVPRLVDSTDDSAFICC